MTMRCVDCGRYCLCGPRDLCLCEPVCPDCQAIADTLPPGDEEAEEGHDRGDEEPDKPT
jgi:hypothetical protein